MWTSITSNLVEKKNFTIVPESNTWKSIMDKAINKKIKVLFFYLTLLFFCILKKIIPITTSESSICWKHIYRLIVFILVYSTPKHPLVMFLFFIFWSAILNIIIKNSFANVEKKEFVNLVLFIFMYFISHSLSINRIFIFS